MLRQCEYKSSGVLYKDVLTYNDIPTVYLVPSNTTKRNIHKKKKKSNQHPKIQITVSVLKVKFSDR